MNLHSKYSTEIEIKEFSYKEFLAITIDIIELLEWEVESIFSNGLTAMTKGTFRSSLGEDVKFEFNDGMVNISSECKGRIIEDFGKNKENVEDFILNFNEYKNQYTADEIEEIYLRIESNLKSHKIENNNKIKMSFEDKFELFVSFFIPTNGRFVTTIIIDINIAIFILMMFSGVGFFNPEPKILIKWGANFSPYTIDGEWWRLFTNFFLHIGIMHLLFNLYALLFIGILLEPIIGRYKFFFIYMISGLMASLSSTIINNSTVSAGASGAIFGLYGLFISLLITNSINKNMKKNILTSIIIFVIFNLLNGLKGGIDNAAHIGGLLSGFLIGIGLSAQFKTKSSRYFIKYLYIFISLFLIVSSIFFLKNERHYDIRKYDMVLQKFFDNEKKALMIFQNTENKNKESLKQEITENSLKKWYFNKSIIKEANKLYLPDQVRIKNNIILGYCDLRIKQCNALILSLDNDTNSINELRIINIQIENNLFEFSKSHY